MHAFKLFKITGNMRNVIVIVTHYYGATSFFIKNCL